MRDNHDNLRERLLAYGNEANFYLSQLGDILDDALELGYNMDKALHGVQRGTASLACALLLARTLENSGLPDGTERNIALALTEFALQVAKESRKLREPNPTNHEPERD